MVVQRSWYHHKNARASSCSEKGPKATGDCYDNKECNHGQFKITKKSCISTCPVSEIIVDVNEGDDVIIVDTNNPAELPASINFANILEIIDHHMLVGGIRTKCPINITMRPLACTATIMADIMASDLTKAPEAIKGIMLSCILSDTLEFRSPTTTETDVALAHLLADELVIDINSYATDMFAAKSDVSAFSDSELLRMDSKMYEVGGKNFRVSVLETTSPTIVLNRKVGLMDTMKTVAREDGVDQVLMFVVDILNEQSTLLVANDLVKTVAEKSFGVTVVSDTILLPGVISRKKQIIPQLVL